MCCGEEIALVAAFGTPTLFHSLKVFTQYYNTGNALISGHNCFTVTGISHLIILIVSSSEEKCNSSFSPLFLIFIRAGS